MKMPTERQLRNLVKRICRDFNVEEPTLVFTDELGEGRAETDCYRRRIIMPTYGWVSEHRAAVPMGYRLLMLHEMAHWLMGKPGVGSPGHTPEFYQTLWHLCVAYDVDLDYAFEDELAYKPRAARRGIRLWLDQLYDRQPGKGYEIGWVEGAT